MTRLPIFFNPYELREAYERHSLPKHAYAKGPSVMDLRALAARMAYEHAQSLGTSPPLPPAPASLGWGAWHSQPPLPAGAGTAGSGWRSALWRSGHAARSPVK